MIDNSRLPSSLVSSRTCTRSAIRQVKTDPDRSSGGRATPNVAGHGTSPHSAGWGCHRPCTPRPPRLCPGAGYRRGSVQFGILGPLEVRSASGEVPIRRGLPRTILIALVLRRGHTVASDFLVDLLWADEPPRNPANALQIQVSYLRKTLGAAGPNGSTLLETRAGGYALLVEPEQIDAHRFEAAVKAFTPVQALTCRGGAAPGAGRGRGCAGVVAR